jgi:hypothetical protein
MFMRGKPSTLWVAFLRSRDLWSVRPVLQDVFLLLRGRIMAGIRVFLAVCTEITEPVAAQRC